MKYLIVFPQYNLALLCFERACKNNLTDSCLLASQMIAKKQ